MSILIPGKMPTRCWDCPMCYDMIGCSLTGERWWSDSHVYLDFSPGEERMCNCPLIELPTHGRLIDADALWEKEKSERALKKHRPKDQSIIFDAGFLAGFRAAAQIASKMPTILPADPEGGADG